MNRNLTFATLGPVGTNHEMVTRRYLDFHGLKAAIVLVDDFFAGLRMISDGQVDHMIQAAVHPDCTDVVATAHFDHGIHVIDTFISPSKALAILTRAEIKRPRTLALQPATRRYADISAWPEHVDVNSIMGVAEGLLAGHYDSGLTTLELVEMHPGCFRVDTAIGTVDDPWLVFGRARVAGSGLVAWPDSPGVKQVRLA